ncbi:MAG: hypothetical protein Kow00109_17570 [Acidobacteriota bacterium]
MRTRRSRGRTLEAARWQVAMLVLLAGSWLGVLPAAVQGSQEGFSVTPPPGQMVEQPKEPLVFFRKSGGFAGGMEEVWVDRNGVYFTASGRGRLDSSEKSSLARLLDAVVGSEGRSPSAPAPCADCVYYDLTLYTAKGPRAIRIADIQLGDGPLRELVTLLESVLVEKEAR